MTWTLVCLLLKAVSVYCFIAQIFEPYEKTELDLPWLVFRIQWLAALFGVRLRLLEKPVKILHWFIWLENFKPIAVNQKPPGCYLY